MPIVAAAFTMVHSESPARAAAIEAAQLAAVAQAYADGVAPENGPELLRRKQAATAQVLHAESGDLTASE